MSYDDEGGFSPPSPHRPKDVMDNLLWGEDKQSNQASGRCPGQPEGARILYELIKCHRWDEASKRCRHHPRDATSKNHLGWLPLHHACYERAPLSLFRCLHEAYPEGIRTADNAGSLPIHAACMYGAPLGVIQYLHEAYGAGIRAKDVDGRLPIHSACEGTGGASPGVIRYLHEAYLEGVRTEMNRGHLPIHLACMYGAPLEVIWYLHDLYPEGATRETSRGHTPQDLLLCNGKFSDEDKDAARAILSTTPRPGMSSVNDPTESDPVSRAMTTPAEVYIASSTSTPTISKTSPVDADYDHHPFDEMTTAHATRKLMDMIRNGRWAEATIGVLRMDRDECEKLFHFACRWGPSTDAVHAFLRVGDMIPRKFDVDHELPIHVLCRFGAERGAIESLLRVYPKSKTMRSGLTEETPLDLAQTRKWIFHENDQVDVIWFLRRQSFPQHFDDMTRLPRGVGFDLWAHIQPPGLTNSNAIVLYVDIAGLRAVNHTFSFGDGDHIIKKCALEISRACEVHAESTQVEICVPHEVYHMGGDEFVVVCKFVSEPGNMWKDAMENLATSLSELSLVDDEQEGPPRYSTFVRIGCAAGTVSNIGNVMHKADELKGDVKRRMGLKRGERASLGEMRRRGKSNVSDLYIRSDNHE